MRTHAFANSDPHSDQIGLGKGQSRVSQYLFYYGGKFVALRSIMKMSFPSQARGIPNSTNAKYHANVHPCVLENPACRKI
jgi:hypothetical protein